MLDARAELQRLIDERREDYASLSRLLGRNAAYVQQYMKRGSPKKLPEDERRTLARYFGSPGGGMTAGGAGAAADVPLSEDPVVTMSNTLGFEPNTVRIKAGETGYDNLFITGDWTDNNLYLAFMEGTFQAGILSARAVAGEKFPIIGEWLNHL